MRRIRGLAGLTLSLVAISGCVAVSSKGNKFGTERQAVVVGDRILVVDTREGIVYELKASDARPFVPAEPSEVESIH